VRRGRCRLLHSLNLPRPTRCRVSPRSRAAPAAIRSVSGETTTSSKAKATAVHRDLLMQRASERRCRRPSAADRRRVFIRLLSERNWHDADGFRPCVGRVLQFSRSSPTSRTGARR
jgi:hypothetical protein